MENGYSAEEALNLLLKKDNSKSVRQVAMIDVNGSVAAHTGENCIYAAGHKVGPNFSPFSVVSTLTMQWKMVYAQNSAPPGKPRLSAEILRKNYM